jgi:hypothetical protein
LAQNSRDSNEQGGGKKKKKRNRKRSSGDMGSALPSDITIGQTGELGSEEMGDQAFPLSLFEVNVSAAPLVPFDTSPLY